MMSHLGANGDGSVWTVAKALPASSSTLSWVNPVSLVTWQVLRLTETGSLNTTAATASRVMTNSPIMRSHVLLVALRSSVLTPAKAAFGTARASTARSYSVRKLSDIFSPLNNIGGWSLSLDYYV